MAIQTEFNIDHKIGFVGQIVDGQLKNQVSRPNISNAVIPFGGLVFGDGNATGTVADFVGVALREVANRSYMPGTTAGYAPGKMISVLTDGVIYVEAPDATTKDTPVYIVAGKLAITGADDELLPNAKWLQTVAKGEIVKLKLTIGA